MSSASSSFNSFDFIRLVAAFGVLLSHSYPLVGLHEILYGNNLNVGTVCVFVFFSISGYLIQKSWDRSKSVIAFIVHRTLRIYPGLIVCLFLTTIIFSLVSTCGYLEYFSAASTYLYIFSNIVPVFVPWQDSLPGVFETIIYPHSINGSLWTIRYEIVMYFFLLILVLLTRNRLSFLIIFVAMALVAWLYSYFNNINEPGQLIWRVQHLNLDGVFLFRLAPFFLVGAVLAKLRPSIINNYAFMLSLLVITVFNDSAFNLPLLWLGLPYCVIYLAINLPACFKNWAKHGDYSYGIYLYAFPVQQVVSNIDCLNKSHVLTLSISSVVVFALSYCSWHFVECPALDNKHRLIRILRGSWKEG